MQLRTVLAVLCVVLAVVARAAPHEVTSLPNLDVSPFPSRQYTGVIDVAPDRGLFYWYVEAEESPETAPLALWLNGGA